MNGWGHAELARLIAAVTGTGKVERLSRLPERVALSEIIAGFADTRRQPPIR